MSFYPDNWPRCHCGRPVLDGHLTCGRVECGTQAEAAGRRIDQYIPVPAVGVPIDMGWAIGTLNADDTFTRTCKGCGVRVTTAVDAKGEVAPVPIDHRDNCPVYARLGNNPTLS